ncbi:preprotein translocase subunit SecG [Thiohalorhabdus methylotrophus]|uniref:Protein-export membrane protein SecG n=1 Tax=Thiohalorhabdus methylotrophus TaxID=3242694 RepID=A0ABV4TWP1_9GAMM
MVTILWIIHVIVSIALIGVVLMQPGQSGGMGTAFGGGGSQTLFGSQGSTGFLGRVTGILGTVFFLSSLSLAVLSTGGDESLMEQPAPAPTQQQETTPNTPEPPTDSPAAPGSGAGGAGSQIPSIPGSGGGQGGGQ